MDTCWLQVAAHRPRCCYCIAGDGEVLCSVPRTVSQWMQWMTLGGLLGGPFGFPFDRYLMMTARGGGFGLRAGLEG